MRWALFFFSLATAVSQTIPAALSTHSAVAGADDALLPVLLRGDTLPSYLTLAAACEAAQELASPYWQARLERFARHDPKAQSLLAARRASNLRTDSLEKAALDYVRLAAAAPQGPGAEVFQNARRHFTDAQLTELSLLAAYLNWSARLAFALNLNDPGDTITLNPSTPPSARVSLPGPALTPNLPAAFLVLQPLRQTAPAVLRLRAAHDSLRSRRLAALASFSAAQVNFAGYTLPLAVASLRQSGLPSTQIARLPLGDDGLSAQEKAVVVFARKLTVSPAESAPDFVRLRAAVGSSAALDVLLAAAWSSFIQRLGDGLHLPADPAARQSYQEVFRSAPPSQLALPAPRR